jgi:serine protease Do
MNNHRKIALILIASLAGWQSVCAQDLSAIFAQVKPAVVVIETESAGAPNTLGLTGTELGFGSGVLITDTQVLTAAHVVQSADVVDVVFYDGQFTTARVVSSIHLADVALLELEEKPEDIKPVPLGDSDGVRIGEQIFIVGAPYGLSYTLTVGHVSNRFAPQELGNDFAVMEFFQTDAAINEGNSGGPMFNLQGEVIGIVSHIISKSGSFEGLGFAATSSATSKLLLEGKHVWSGVETQLISRPITTLLNVPQSNALLVQRVAGDSLGSKLKLRPGTVPVTIGNQTLMLGGDIILEVMGVPIEGTKSLLKIRKKVTLIEKHKAVSVVVWRRGKRVVLEHKLFVPLP